MRWLCSFLFLGLALSCAAESRSALEVSSEGWTDLTEAKGWVRVPIPATAALNPENQWHYDPATKSLTCTGDKGHEMLRSGRQYGGDFVYHVEWRFKPLEGNPRYNSGVFVLASENGEYFYQAQVGPGPKAWLFSDFLVDGKKQRLNLRDQPAPDAVRPPGEWNTFEVTVARQAVTLWVNGENINLVGKTYTDRGYVGLEAEGFPIEFRNVKIKALP